MSGGIDLLTVGIIQFVLIFLAVIFFLKATAIFGKNDDTIYILISLSVVVIFYFVKVLFEFMVPEIHISPIVKIMTIVLILQFIVILSLERKHLGLQIFFIILFTVGFITTLLYVSNLFLNFVVALNITQDKAGVFINISYIYLILVINETGALISYVIIRTKLITQILEFVTRMSSK